MLSKDISRFLDVPHVANRLMPIQESIDFNATRAKTNFCVLTALGLLSLGGGAALLTLLLTGGVGSDLSWVALGSGIALTVIGSGFLLSMCYLVAHRVCDVRDLREDQIQNSFITYEELLTYFTTAENPAIAQKLSQLDLEEFPLFVKAIKDIELEQGIVEAIAQLSYERGLPLPPELLDTLIDGSSKEILLGLIDRAPDKDQQQILNRLTELAKSSYQKNEKVSKEHLEKLVQLCSIETLIELIEYTHTEEDQTCIVKALEERAMSLEQGQDLPADLLNILCHFSTIERLKALNTIASEKDKKDILKGIAYKTYEEKQNLPMELLEKLIDVSSIEALIDLIKHAPKEGDDRQRIARELEKYAMNSDKKQNLPPRLLEKLFKYSSVEFLISLIEIVSEKDMMCIIENIYNGCKQPYLDSIGGENFEKLLHHTSINKLIELCIKLQLSNKLSKDNEMILNEFERKTTEMFQSKAKLSKEHLSALRGISFDALMRLYDHASMKYRKEITHAFEAHLVNKLILKIKLEEYVSREVLSKYLELSSIEVIVNLFSYISLEDNRKPFLEELEKRAMESYEKEETVTPEHLELLLKESSVETLFNLMNCASKDRVSILAEVAKRTYRVGHNLEGDLLEELIEKTPNATLESLRSIAPHEDETKINHALLMRALTPSKEKREEDIQPSEVKEKEKVESIDDVSFNRSEVLNIKILERASLLSTNSVIENLVSSED